MVSKSSHWRKGRCINAALLGNHAFQGEAEAGDFAAVARAGCLEDFVAEAEVAVCLTPLDLADEGVDHAEKPK